MVDEAYMPLLGQILDLLDTACQASLELLTMYASEKTVDAMQMLDDLSAVCKAVDNARQPLLPQLERACIAEWLENVQDTVSDIQNPTKAGRGEQVAMKTEFQLLPFLRCLREAFYFWGTVYPDKQRMDAYYREEFAPHLENPYTENGGENPMRLSIAVTGYNHLETTKRCVEQLLKETDFDKLQAELILIDHGSTDGTLEYFESLGVGKVIHFKRNVRIYMFAALSMLCRGKYFCFVSNDVLVTRNWAEILLNCLDSDEKIIAAVPATPNIANLQSVGLPNLGPEEFIAWAAGQNRPDPACWNDRARLMPPLGMYRTAAVSQIGFADPYFYSMEYWDDDFSLRARRAGYRQIVCNDVACYHFGSVTGKAAQRKENTLVYGRELFQRKNGVDAWGTGCCYDYTLVQLFRQLPPLPQEYPAVLGLNCGMGDTLLQVRNELRHLEKDCAIWQLTSQEAYLPDLVPLSAGAAFTPNLARGVASAFGKQKFSLIWIEGDLSMYEGSEALLSAAARRLAPGGYLFFFCANPFYVATLHALLNFSVPDDRCVLTNSAELQRQAEQHFSPVKRVALEHRVSGLEAFAKMHYGQTKQMPQIVERLGIEKYYFICGKKAALNT